MYLENQLLKERNPEYPVHMVKVPTDMGFVDGYPGDLFFIRFEEIFSLVHLQWMGKSLVHLISLSMSHNIIIERRGRVAIWTPSTWMSYLLMPLGIR
jgi:hypothetical protein